MPYEPIHEHYTTTDRISTDLLNMPQRSEQSDRVPNTDTEMNSLQECMSCVHCVHQKSDISTLRSSLQPTPCSVLSTNVHKPSRTSFATFVPPGVIPEYDLHSSTTQRRRTHNQNGRGFYSLWLCILVTVVAVSSVAAGPIAGIKSRTEVLQNVVELFPDDQADIDDYLDTFGYYNSRRATDAVSEPPSSTVEATVLSTEHINSQPVHSSSERKQALRRLQNFFHLRTTGDVTSETRAVLKASRCGRRDLNEDGEVEMLNGAQGEQGGSRMHSPESQHRQKRYAVNRYSDGTVLKWRLHRLSWKITMYSSQMPQSEQRRAMRESFAMWGSIIPITFVEHTGTDEPDIVIKFARGEHGNKFDPVFDGRRQTHNTLAHAWGPALNPKGLPGDVHFDEDDLWTNFNELKAVALHELGHSMGLLHSRNRSAIMYPIYRDLLEFGQDDLDGVNFLYGSGIEEITQPPPKTTRPGKWYTVKPEWVTPPKPQPVAGCTDIKVDAVFQDPSARYNDVYFVISGDRVHRLSSRGEVIQSQSLDKAFPQLPREPGVALSVLEEQKTYFIKGNTMWAYKNGALVEGYPRSVQDMRFPEQPRYSIISEDSVGNSRTLLFGRQYWWTFDEHGRFASRYSPISEFSRDIPDGVMFAARWSDNHLYAVTSDSYVVLDMNRRRAIHTSPIAGKPDWLHKLCESSSSSQVQASVLLLIVTAVFGKMLQMTDN